MYFRTGKRVEIKKIVTEAVLLPLSRGEL